MATGGDFSKMVPGFDFLQGLMKTAGSALPAMGQWIAPTLDPDELDKRIEELRTVQFWLEQNARMLAATIQALEVQRMTLSTLKTMNMPVADMAEAFKIHAPAPVGRPAAPAPAAAPPEMPAAKRKTSAKPAAGASGPAGAGAVPAGVVDPMQWWGALTQQFTQLAAQALKDTGANGGGKAVQTADGAAAGKTEKSTAKPARAARSRRRA